MDSRLINESKEEEMKAIFPDSLSKIIQSYLSDDKPTTGEKVPLLAFSSFFEKPSLLYAHRLAYYAAWGQPEQFEAIVKLCPEALLVTVAIRGPHIEKKEPDINILKATPYQVLIQQNDNYITDKEGRTFAEMAKSYFPDAKTADKQEKDWFKDWDEEAHVEELQTAFDKALKAFDDSKAMTEKALDEDTLLQKAIQDFKEYLKTAVYKAKKNCIPQLWDYSARKYTIERYQAYGGYDSSKNRLVCFQIYGAIDVKSGAWVMQVLHHRIYEVVNNNKVVLRTDVSSYYDSDRPSGLHLGLNSYMSIFGESGRGGARWVGAGREWGCFFQSYVKRQNQRARQNISITQPNLNRLDVE